MRIWVAIVAIVISFISLAVFFGTVRRTPDYTIEIASALQTSPVYIEPGTEGVDETTDGYLTDALGDSSEIALVLLPKSAEATMGMTPYEFAGKISEKLADSHVIALAVGDKIILYDKVLVKDVSIKKMTHAKSESTDKVVILGTFAQNLDEYLDHVPPARLAFWPERHHTKWWELVLIFLGAAAFTIGGYGMLGGGSPSYD